MDTKPQNLDPGAGDITRATKVTHVVASLERASGGPSYTVPRLAKALAAHGCPARLRTLRTDAGIDAASAPFVHVAPGSKGIFAARLARSAALKAALMDDAKSGSVLHTHGLWLMPNLYPAAVKRAVPGTKLVHAPRGMLGGPALAISRRRKRALWLLAQRRALAAADCLHATAHLEYEDIRAQGLQNPVAIVPNGVDIPPPAEHRPSAPDQTVLSLGRIHPKKGLDTLVRAWSAVERTHPHARLRIVGPGENGHERALAVLAEDLGLKRVAIEGPVYGAARLHAYRSAAVFVLPTRHENFAMTVAEALAAGTPVISTVGAPWAGLRDNRCGWWVDHGVEALEQALLNALALPHEERVAMGARGRGWMQRDFSWDRIAADMAAVYSWLAAGGAPPSCVALS